MEDHRDQPAPAPVAEANPSRYPPDHPTHSPLYKARLRKILVHSVLYQKFIEECSVPPLELGIPSRTAAPREWNWHYEQVYERKYGQRDRDAAGDYAETLKLGDIVDLSYHANGPLARRDAEEAERKLLAVQAKLVWKARHALMDNFVEHWEKQDSRQSKINILLEALVRAAGISTQRARVDCPEMSLFSLLDERKEEGEDGMMSLLWTISKHDYDDENPKIFSFPHPKVAAELKPFTLLPAAHWLHEIGRLRLAQRNLFISAMLLSVLDLVGHNEDRAELYEAQEDIDACFHCGKQPNEAPLSKCSGCSWALYCSPACQKQGWKDHKHTCAGAKRFNLKAKEEPDNMAGASSWAEYIWLERALMKWG